MKRPMQREATRRRTAVVGAAMLGFALSLAAQSPPEFPTITEHVPLKTYINDVLGFELSYPVSYRRRNSSSAPSPSNSKSAQPLLYAAAGAGERRCEDEGECNDFGTIVVALDPRHFNLDTIVRSYPHTGWDNAEPFHLGGHAFYYMGTGGGGAMYPDTFFYNLRGRILIIEFSGPYPKDSKSPSEETRRLEPIVLKSLHLRSKPQVDK